MKIYEPGVGGRRRHRSPFDGRSSHICDVLNPRLIGTGQLRVLSVVQSGIRKAIGGGSTGANSIKLGCALMSTVSYCVRHLPRDRLHRDVAARLCLKSEQLIQQRLRYIYRAQFVPRTIEDVHLAGHFAWSLVDGDTIRKKETGMEYLPEIYARHNHDEDDCIKSFTSAAPFPLFRLAIYGPFLLPSSAAPGCRLNRSSRRSCQPPKPRCPFATLASEQFVVRRSPFS